jgi:hypothetical protein
MPKQIYESDLVVVSHDTENDIAVVKWKKECGNILEFKHEKQLETVQTTLHKISPEKLMADLSGCEYIIKPDTGPWHENPIFSMYTQTPAGKIALILPKNLFVSAFFDASRAQEQIDVNTNLQYFDDPEKAMNWLNSG